MPIGDPLTLTRSDPDFETASAVEITGDFDKARVVLTTEVGKAPNTWTYREAHRATELSTRTPPVDPIVGDQANLYGSGGTVIAVDGTHATVEIVDVLTSPRGIKVTRTHVVPYWRLELP